ncbi:hypothetical protein [Arachidicoccus sp.]|uniref:hypothetical protein n=1 Tax=Arachidicoccus sp. TaxID=1872624 RepID=UPI003D1FAFC3
MDKATRNYFSTALTGLFYLNHQKRLLCWAFCSDPYIKTIQAENFSGSNPDAYNNNQYSPYEGKFDSIIMGE